jgi:hypothetical protein
MSKTDQKLQPQEWSTQVIKASIELYKGIWEDRNEFLHGANRKEHQQKTREKVVDRVKEIYSRPPKLDKRYQRTSTGKTASQYDTPTTVVGQSKSSNHVYKTPQGDTPCDPTPNFNLLPAKSVP